MSSIPIGFIGNAVQFCGSSLYCNGVEIARCHCSMREGARVGDAPKPGDLSAMDTLASVRMFGSLFFVHKWMCADELTSGAAVLLFSRQFSRCAE